ncbi:MAG: hypothetical protein ACRD3S_04015 [Terracidiphilus sp.]
MASTSQIAAAPRSRAFTAPGGFLDRYFYFAMSLVAAAAVVAGFGETVGEKLFHPAVTPPGILWVHGAVFSSWIVFFIFQSALVRTRNVRWHRLLGWAGVGLAALMVPLGVSTAILMVRFEAYRLHQQGRFAFLAIPFFDISVFALCIALAIAWRRKPELHRRLIFFATCALLVAAFARMDHGILRAHNLIYVGPDLLLVLGVGRDLLVNRRVHAVYKVGLPAYLVAQLFVIYLWRVGPEWWVHLMRAIAG